MPYPTEHKPKTHARIVRAASRLFRRRGFARTGVDRLMADAGLTRGGFYAHFADKSRLLVEALEQAFDESRDNLLARGLEHLRGTDWVRAAGRRYLTSEHARAPADGCPIPSLGAEVSRAPRSVRVAFEKRLLEIADGMRRRLGDRNRRRALRLLASWTGAMLLARAVADPALSEEILSAARD
jgi:TetR/AcrR family transcriptional regulator, transcriptional repressor for nem operon